MVLSSDRKRSGVGQIQQKVDQMQPSQKSVSLESVTCDRPVAGQIWNTLHIVSSQAH